MPFIRPVSDLQNNFAEISRVVQESGEPVFLTENGAGSLVVMSMECYEQWRYESEVYNNLCEAELEAIVNSKTFSRDEVMAALGMKATKASEAQDV